MELLACAIDHVTVKSIEGQTIYFTKESKVYENHMESCSSQTYYSAHGYDIDL